MTSNKIESTSEAWEDRLLGASDEFASVAEIDNDAIDESLGLKMISIRLEKALIEDFKFIASLNNGMGYQTLMRQALKRFVVGEKKQIAIAIANRKVEDESAKVELEKPSKKSSSPRQRRAA